MKRVSMKSILLLGGLFLVLLAACKKDDPYDPIPQLNKEVAEIKAYLEENNLTATLDSASGIYYNLIEPGNGVDSVKYFGTKVKVLYTGRLMSDSTIVFDSTGITPREFVYNDLIGGWQFGLRQMTKGGKIKLYIPSFWAYGNQAQNGIPANSTLIFDMELLDLTNPQ